MLEDGTQHFINLTVDVAQVDVRNGQLLVNDTDMVGHFTVDVVVRLFEGVLILKQVVVVDDGLVIL